MENGTLSHFGFVFIYCISFPDLTIWSNMLEHLQLKNERINHLWVWLIEQLLGNLKNSLCPLLFADFDEFLLHQAAQIQTDVLLIYFMTWHV